MNVLKGVGTVGIPRIPKDFKKLIEDHRKLLDLMEQIPFTCQHLIADVQDSADRMLDEQMLAVLDETPVEELNREKRGIRIKTLKDQGYQTMADLYRADAAAVAAINGISDDGAREIRRITDDLAKTARSGSKIRLNLDRRTDGSAELVRSLSCYLRSKEPGKICRQLLNEGKVEIHTAIQALDGAGNPFLWLFTSKEKKQKAHEAYRYLSDQMAGSYGTAAKKQLRLFRQLKTLSREQAWEDFARRPIVFLQTLEELCPGMVETEEDVYGLPETLAGEIQEEPIELEGLRCQLRRYQQWGVKYILHQGRVLLGDEMGLGKTVQAIAAMVSLKNTGATHFLVVCPASVLENWCREIRKHSTLTVVKVHGDGREEALQTWMKSGGVAVTTYETSGIFELPQAFRFSMAVVDEAHYIKNPEAQRTARVREICTHGERLLFMTGTALENRVDEMITLISFLQPWVAQEIRAMASLSSAPQFREKIAPVYYRRKREDVLKELPDLIENEEWCVLGKEEEAIYEAAVLDRRYSDARRVSWSAARPEQSCKAQRMLELIEEAKEENRKVIVFSFFLDTIAKVKSLLGDRCLQPINGSVAPQRRQEIVDEFDRAPAGTVLAAQIQAGGTGLNIQAASVVILCEPQFKPSTENQAVSRAYRMGQTRNVLVYRLLCEDTVDERITQILETKQAEFDAFADESAAARESLELDQKGFGNIIQEEIDRITRKNLQKPNSPESMSDSGEDTEKLKEFG